MVKRAKRETKLVSVYSDLIAKLKEVSIKENMPLTECINEVLEQAVRAYSLGTSIKEVVDFYEKMLIHHEAGLIMIPLEVLNRMIEKLSHEEKLLEDLWYEYGSWYGRYLSVRIKNNDPTNVLKDLLKNYGWKVKWTPLEADEEVSIKCFSQVMSLEATKLLMKFIEGAMKALGYEVLSTSFLKGFIELKVRQKRKKVGG